MKLKRKPIGEKYAVSGAQSPQVLQQVLERTLAEQKPTTLAGGESCEGDVCES